MGFSITSAVFGGIIIFFYGIGISLIISKDAKIYYDNVESYNKYYHVKVVILPVMLIMGIATFLIGIWAAICTCLLKPCCEQPEVQYCDHNLNSSRGFLNSVIRVCPPSTLK